MEPNTLRLPEHTWPELSEEADDLGFPNRSAYIRWLLENRDLILAQMDDGPDVNSEHFPEITSDYEELRERLEDMERRLAKLEEERPDQEGAEPDPDHDADHDRAPDRDREPDRARDLEGDDRPAGEAVDNLGPSEAIDAALDDWWPKRKREERRAAGRAALEYLRDAGRGTKSDFLSALRPEYDVADQNDDTYWKKTVRPALQAAKDDGLVGWERGPPHEYVWHGPE